MCILGACTTIEAAGKSKQVHDRIARQGLPQNNVAKDDALVHMYAKCGLAAGIIGQPWEGGPNQRFLLRKINGKQCMAGIGPYEGFAFY